MVSVLEQGGHGRDAHLPDGVVDSKEENDRCCVFADEDAERTDKVDSFSGCELWKRCVPFNSFEILICLQRIPRH